MGPAVMWQLFVGIGRAVIVSLGGATSLTVRAQVVPRTAVQHQRNENNYLNGPSNLNTSCCLESGAIVRLAEMRILSFICQVPAAELGNL